MIFSLSPGELKVFASWKEEQDIIAEALSIGAIGGRFTYSFTPTGLGVITEVTDNITKQTLNLTEYEYW